TASDATLGRSVPVGVSVTAVGGEESRLLSGSVVQSEAQLEAAARAKLNHHRAGEVIFSGLALGDPRLRPGTPVDVVGLPADISGRYVVSAADHLIDQYRGYLCELSTAPTAPFESRPGCHATLGVVSAVSDPEQRGRVKVELPALGDVESGWLQVLAAGAGAGKGLTMLPGVADTVLVLVPLEDPSQGIVLGGLFGEPGTVDPGVAAGQVRRYTFMSPAGQRVVLDDESGTLSLDDGQGSRLELSPQRVRITSATELDLEAAAGVRIKGRTVDFEKA
ncbi:MAG TPA: phage baseplate assembly protein V, partial [Trueperaceae bacterium]|nr:phage baseplate assembly protein V [Trueperaceae bacterium]